MPRNPAPAGEYPFQYRWRCIKIGFVATAKPRRNCGVSFPALAPPILMVIRRPKTAPGNGTNAAQNYGADRDDFGDTIDFIGWYNNVSNEQLGIDKQDAFRLYLAYHEGHGGYRNKVTVAGYWSGRAQGRPANKSL